jgi:hypothetical protein
MLTRLAWLALGSVRVAAHAAACLAIELQPRPIARPDRSYAIMRADVALDILGPAAALEQVGTFQRVLEHLPDLIPVMQSFRPRSVWDVQDAKA